jgi:hypothetical protein
MAFAQADAGAMQYFEKCSPLLHMFLERKAPIPLQNTCACTCVCVCVCARKTDTCNGSHTFPIIHTRNSYL